LRILHVNHTLDLGGTEVMMLDLAKEQKKLGQSVTICSMYGPGLLDGKAAEYGLPVVHLNSRSSLSAKVKSLTTYLSQHPQDIVHSHWGVWLPTAIAGFLKRVPRVHTHHSNQQRRLFLEHRVASFFTNKVVVLTPQVDDYIKKWVAVPKRKIAVIPNGIDFSRVEGAARVELDSIPHGATVVGMVARLSPPKDYPTFISAAKLVLDRFPDVHFIAVGEGRMRPQFEAQVAQLGLKNFHFLGGRLDVPEVLQRMTIKVLATKNEGLPITLLEALASGCACIASDIPANRFTLDDGNSGLLVPGQDPPALAAAIERLLIDPDLRQKLKRSAAQRSQYFTAHRMAKDYVELCRNLQK
jgi:glycosyltransferase involved in cell wall biosynthesis